MGFIPSYPIQAHTDLIDKKLGFQEKGPIYDLTCTGARIGKLVTESRISISQLLTYIGDHCSLK